MTTRDIITIAVELEASLDAILFEQPEPKKKKYHPILGTVGALALPGLAVNTGSSALLSSVQKPGHQRLNDLLEHLRNPELPTPPKWAAPDRGIRASLEKAAASKGVKISESEFSPYGPGAYVDSSKSIHITPKTKDYFKPGILAHELGHVEQSKLLRSGAMHGIGKIGVGASGLTAAFTGNESTAKKAALAGAGLSAGVIASEISATARGIKHLRKGGIKGLRSLTPGVGLATYAAMAATPALTYKVKKALGGYRQSPQ